VVFHQFKGGMQASLGLGDASHQRVGMRQQHEGQAIAMVGAVQHLGVALVPVDHPGIAALGLGMGRLHKAQAMARGCLVFGAAKGAKGCGVVENKARAAHQMAGAMVVDRAVALEVVKESAGWIQCPAFVKGQRVADVVAQKGRGAKVS